MFAASRGARSRCVTSRASAKGGRIARHAGEVQYVFRRIYAKACRPNRLISQWLARLQSVRDAFLRFPFAAQRDESFALEVQHVLFADELRRAQCSARKNVRQLSSNDRIVLCRVA